MRKAMTLEAAKAEVEGLLREAELKRSGMPEVKVTLHMWWDGRLDEAPQCVGVRIQEIGFIYTSMCGSSIMAVEPEALGACAAAERCIIERMVCTSDQQYWDDEIKDADDRLLTLAFPKKGE